MSMNDTPSGERVHIGFFGRRNAGKSSLVNAVTGQDLSVVSDVPGTTTDPVKKAMELLPLGPVEITDTPGFDDEGALGELRVKKTRKILDQTDIAVLAVDASEGLKECDRELIGLFDERKVPYIIAFTKADLSKKDPADNMRSMSSGDEIQDNSRNLSIRHEENAKDADASYTSKAVQEKNIIHVSALDGTNIHEFKERLARLIKPENDRTFLCGDLIRPGDMVLLVIPIDKAAPKGRLILPQQMVIRDILDNDAIPVCVKEDRLEDLLKTHGIRPALVITDSQVFKEVSAIVPEEIPLTSFSILMARHKGFLKEAVKGARYLETMRADGQHGTYRVLIAEGCTHHRQCNDIGTVKIPMWLEKYTGGRVIIETASGQDFPEDLKGYDLVIHCGGCMLNEREVLSRIRRASLQGVPVTNYGTAIAQFTGILERSVSMLPEVQETFSA